MKTKQNRQYNNIFCLWRVEIKSNEDEMSSRADEGLLRTYTLNFLLDLLPEPKSPLESDLDSELEPSQ
ncbi:hypothetical protein HI914_01963 [Erysiphe necator]|nr:hypothetical protein HI914_01963 [Erysiphe necator]